MSEDSGAPDEEISVDDELSIDELDTDEQDALLSTMESALDETELSVSKSSPPNVETAPDADPDEGGELESTTVPGGTPAAAAFHQARTVCRRAERAVVALGRAEALDPLALGYLNRLSDLLFVLARSLDRAAGGTDQLWAHERRPKPRA